MRRVLSFGASLLLIACAAWPALGQSVMQQCGQQYQAAKAANTLSGETWNQFRVECAAKLKATPASTGAAGQAPAPVSPPVATNPLKPAASVAVTPPAATPASVPAAPVTNTAAPATTTAGKPMSAGRTAFVTRERECGAEWRANKVSLVAQTPGLTWPKYLSQCNTRLKAAGQ